MALSIGMTNEFMKGTNRDDNREKTVCQARAVSNHILRNIEFDTEDKNLRRELHRIVKARLAFDIRREQTSSQ